MLIIAKYVQPRTAAEMLGVHVRTLVKWEQQGKIQAINFKRQKLTALLEQVMSGDVATIVVAHQDRLARFGFDWFDWFCRKFECSIVVLNETNLSPEAEMVEDIIAILHGFSSPLYGF